MTNFLSHMSPEIKQYLVKSEDFKEISILGNSESGVLKKMEHIPTGKMCAVKQIKYEDENEMTENDVLYYCRECDVLLKCSDNMFVVPFYGCTSTMPLLIVTEFIPNGNLYDRLRNETQKIDGNQKTIIALGIADGMRMIHAKGAIHRNLNSENILLDEKLFPKITGFGLSRFLHENNNTTSVMMTQSVGTPHWMAPEQFESSSYTNKIDVYAYGILLWEMLTGKSPFEKLKGVQLALAICQKNERPRIPSSTPPGLKKLIQQCWDQDPDNRPTFDEIYNAFASKKVMFEGSNPSSIEYIVGVIKDDNEIREGNLKGEKVPPLKYNKYAVKIDVGAGEPRKMKKRTETVAQKSVFNQVSVEQLEKKQNIHSEIKKVLLSQQNISKDGDVNSSNEMNKAGNVDSENYIDDFDSCLSKLNEDNSAEFFKYTANVLKPGVSADIVNHVMKSISYLIQQNDKYFDDFIQSDWVNSNFPTNSSESIENTFKILRTISIKSPKSITKEMIESISSFAQNNRENGIKVLCILQPILSNFEKMSNKWIVSDYLVRSSNLFLDSCPYEYLECINYLLKNSTQFTDARKDYVISILNTAIKKNDYKKLNDEFFNDKLNNIYLNVQTTRSLSNIFNTEEDLIRSYENLIYCAIYSMMYDIYTPNCQVPEELILRHIRNQETREACISYCMQQKTLKFNKQIMKTLLGFLPDIKEAYYAILCNCDRTQSVENLIDVAGGSWMTNGKMDVNQVAKLLLVNYAIPQMRPKIASLDEFPIALTNMVQSNDATLILASSTLVVKSLKVPSFIDKLKASDYFNFYIRAIRPLTDERSIKSCANLVDTVSRVAYVDHFEYLIDYFARFVQNMNCYTVVTVSALASMCQHKQSASKVKNYNIAPHIQKLVTDPTCGPYARALLAKIA